MDQTIPPEQLNVLFIGNSFTHRNDLPGMLTALAAAGDLPCVITSQRVVVNGASLRLHWNAGTAAALIRSQPWDVVVLQEQSTLPVKNATRYHENVRLFAEVIREQGARIVLYLVWARRNAPEAQAVLNDASHTIAREIGADIAPVGPAWERLRSEPNAPEVFAPDGSHPTPAGTYLAACVFYATLLGRSPAGLPAPTAPGLTPEQTGRIQTIAWETALPHLPSHPVSTRLSHSTP